MSRYKNFSSLKNSLIAFSFGIFITLLSVEVLIRIFESRAKKASWSDRPKYYFRHEMSETMQDFPIKKPKDPNNFRLAVIGDSYSFAPYMQFTDAFPKILERMLNLNSIESHAEVINYGVPAYSTSHEIATTARAIKDDADAILLQITLNDPEIKPYRPKGITVFDSFGKLKLSGWKATILNHWRTGNLIVTRIHNEKTRRDYIKYFNDLFNKENTWNNFETSLRSIVEIASSNNKPIYGAIFPLFGVPLDDNYPFFNCHSKVSKLLEELNVPYIDLFDKFREIPLDRLQVIPGIDRHPNEIAHRLASEAIYDWMVNKVDGIPNKYRIKARFTDRTRIVDEPLYVEPTEE